MEKVRMDKGLLMTILEKNRNEHEALFEEAWAAYEQKVISNLEQMLQAAKRDGAAEVNLHFNLVRPEDHTADYDRALEMLGYEVDDVVELQQYEFTQLVQDDWGWQAQFGAAYTSNTGKPFSK